jgi:hypothetical protein
VWVIMIIFWLVGLFSVPSLLLGCTRPLFSEGTLRFKCLQGGKISSGWGGDACVFTVQSSPLYREESNKYSDRIGIGIRHFLSVL